MALILIVDDEPTLRRTLRVILERGGHEVLEAADGAKASDLYRTRAPDVVLLDMVMPNREGVETIVDLRAIHASARIIAMSGGHRGDLYLSIATGMGADLTLSKPIRAAVLLEAVTACLA